MTSRYKEQEPSAGRHFSVSALQADAAYFGARLALKEGSPPESRYQAAEIKTFSTLNEVMTGILRRLKRGGYSIEPISEDVVPGTRREETESILK